MLRVFALVNKLDRCLQCTTTAVCAAAVLVLRWPGYWEGSQGIVPVTRACWGFAGENGRAVKRGRHTLKHALPSERESGYTDMQRWACMSDKDQPANNTTKMNGSAQGVERCQFHVGQGMRVWWVALATCVSTVLMIGLCQVVP